MKKLLLAVGVSAAAITFAPGVVSADSYSHDDGKDNSWSESSHYDADKCERIGYKLANLNTDFDQNNSWSLDRQQRLVNKASEADCAQPATVVDALVQNGNFTTLTAAVKAAGLVDALSAPGELTVFAPTDQAFAALPAGTVDALLADIPTLTTILTNHVVAGEVDAVAASELDSAVALNGNTLKITSDDEGNLYIDDAKIIVNDIYTGNGVVHIIDAVLVPKM